MNLIQNADLGNGLFGITADLSDSIILTIDRRGFIAENSPRLVELGFGSSDLLILPHIADLADPRFAPSVREYVDHVLRGGPQLHGTQFPLAGRGANRAAIRRDRFTDEPKGGAKDEGSDGGGDGAARPAGGQPNGPPAVQPGKAQWFALYLQPLFDVADGGAEGGAVGRAILRPIDLPPHQQDQLNSMGMVDHLTGLASQQALLSAMAARPKHGPQGMLVLVEIDSFRSLSHRYGPRSGEQMICAFADFLRAMLGDDGYLARIKSARFAFMLENQEPHMADEYVTELLQVFAQLSADLAGKGAAITASAGLAQINGNPLHVVSCAEKALILAASQGGGISRIAETLPHYLARKTCHVQGA